MFQLLLINEMKLLIKDFKFQIFILLSLALFIVSAFSGVSAYNLQTNEFSNLSDNHQKMVQEARMLSLRRLISYNHAISVNDSPSPALLFNSYDDYPNRVTSWILFYNPIYRKIGALGSDTFNLNWNFILGTLMSFMLLILSFEAISKEKRTGTLRLSSLYGFKRQSILFSKYISYMLLYFIIIIPPSLISMILFFAITGTWDISYMTKLLAIILISFPFASFFVLLGIFISMAKNYQKTIITIIFVWLLFVIIIPQTAVLLGRQFAPIKSTVQYQQQKDKAFNDELAIWYQQHGHAVGSSTRIQEGLRTQAVNAADEKRNIVHLQEIDDSIKQMRMVQLISKLSPLYQYEEISEILFDKGSYLFENMQKTLRTSRALIRNLIIEQDKTDSSSLNLVYTWAENDSGDLIGTGKTTFSNQMFEHPNLLFITNIQSDNTLNKVIMVFLKMLPILALNLLLIFFSVLRLEKLDIR